MTGARALIAANVLLVTLAIVLITLDGRSKDTTVDVSTIRISTDLIILPPPTVTTGPPPVVAPVKRPKPPIAGPDVVTGRRVSLAQFRGRPVLVSVWATWNVGSIDQASTLGRFARAHGDEVAVLGIDVEDSATAAKAFIRRYRMDFPSIADTIGKLGYAWATVPTTLVFDRRHMLVKTIPGSASEEQLSSALRAIRP